MLDQDMSLVPVQSLDVWWGWGKCVIVVWSVTHDYCKSKAAGEGEFVS